MQQNWQQACAFRLLHEHREVGSRPVKDIALAVAAYADHTFMVQQH